MIKKKKKKALLPAKLNCTTPVSRVCSDPRHPEIGVKFRDGEKEFKALVISPSALSALSRKEGSTQWELFRASQLTWLVQHSALMNDTLYWKWRKKTSFLPSGDRGGPQSQSSGTHWGRLPGELLLGWRGQTAPVAQAGGGPPLSEPTRHMMGFSAVVNPARPGCCLQVRGRAAEGANPPGTPPCCSVL